MGMLNKQPIIIIDGMNASYRAFHSHSNLKNSKGNSVSLMYGFLNILQGLMGVLNPKRVYIVWDGSKSKERMAIHPEYKAHRSKLGMDIEDFYRQRDEFQKMARALGIRQLHHPKIEADDYICKLIGKLKQKTKTKLVIVSGDKDFGQLVDKQVMQYIPAKGKLYNPINFKTEFGHTPSQVVDFLCLTGDKSDNIPGYGGIGEVRANQFLSRYTSILNALQLENIDKFDKAKLLQVYKKNQQLIDINLFCSMHLEGKEIMYYKDDKRPKKSKKRFLKLCLKHNIRTFATKKFINLF